MPRKATHGRFAGGMLLDFNSGEVEARRAMVSCPKSSVLVADISKFGRNATVRGGHLRDIDHLFTDAPVPEAFGMHCPNWIAATLYVDCVVLAASLPLLTIIVSLFLKARGPLLIRW